MLFGETIADYCENRKNTLCGQNAELSNIKSGGTHIYHQPFEHQFLLLTFDVDNDPLADGRWHPVGGDAQVCAHLRPADAREVQLLAIVHIHCNNGTNWLQG
jgi:hypothetical protein